MLVRLIIALSLISTVVFAHDPNNLPTPEQIARMKVDGSLEDSLLRIKWLEEHKIADGIDNAAYYRLKRDQLKGEGKSETEIANALFGNGPLAAFPFTGVQPELKSWGDRKTLTILIDFKDHRQADELPGMDPAAFARSIYEDPNETRTTLYSPFESVLAYYIRASEGRLRLGGSVLGWYHFDKDREEYEPEPVVRTPRMTNRDVEMLKFIRNQQALYKLATTALDQFEADGHDFAQYDNDNDGDIDNLTILYAGPKGSWASFWWAYQWSFQLTSFTKTYDGKELNQFVFQFVDTRGPGNNDFDPQTLIHETGHALGLPDYYDYDASLPPHRRKGPDGGLGRLDIMDGNWGNHNAFSRWLLDWVEPKVIESGVPASQTLVASSEQQNGTKALALFPGLDPTSTSPGTDMYILEYRRKTGNDGGVNKIPTNGMLLWRVDGTPNSAGTGFKFNNSDSIKKLIRLIRKGSAGDFGNQAIATASDFFEAGDEFTPFTVPSSGSTRLSITDISLNGETADVKVGYLPPSEIRRQQQQQVADSALLNELKDLVGSAKENEVRLSRIETLGRLAADAKPIELEAAWQLLKDEKGNYLEMREEQIAAQNLIIGWSSKDGVAAGRAALELEQMLMPTGSGSGSTHPLYERVMTSWAKAQPTKATAWIETPNQALPDPGQDFAAEVVDYLAKTNPTELQEIANLSHHGFQSSTVRAAMDLIKAPPVAPIDGSACTDLLIDDPSFSHTYTDNEHVHSGLVARPIWSELRPVNDADLSGATFRSGRLGGADYDALTGPGALNVMSYNLESGDADIDYLVDEIEAFENVDIWGFSEVDKDWADLLEQAAGDGEGADFDQILGSTGRSDRLMIVYNSEELDYIDDFELHRINPRVDGSRRVRSALVARFRYKATGQEFMFMVNHLYRGRADRRHEQATLLNEWVAEQEHPVIAVGDYNFDWEVDGGDNDHDLGYDNMTKGDEFTWVRPNSLVKTQKSPSYNSVLDFVFVSKAAAPFAGTSTIIVRSGDIPDDGNMSDHRPVAATFRFPVTFDGNNPSFHAKRFARPMRWESEPIRGDLDAMDSVQLREMVRGLQNDVRESRRLEAGQD